MVFLKLLFFIILVKFTEGILFNCLFNFFCVVFCGSFFFIYYIHLSYNVIHILLQLIIVNLCHTSWWFNHKIHKVIFIHVYLIASRHVLLALLYACRQVHSQFKLFVICTDRNILWGFLSACFWWIMFRDNEVCFIWIFFMLNGTWQL